MDSPKWFSMEAVKSDISVCLIHKHSHTDVDCHHAMLNNTESLSHPHFWTISCQVGFIGGTASSLQSSYYLKIQLARDNLAELSAIWVDFAHAYSDHNKQYGHIDWIHDKFTAHTKGSKTVLFQCIAIMMTLRIWETSYHLRHQGW